MWTKEIVRLLSNHRRLERPVMPQALSMTQILNLLRANLDPNLALDSLPIQVQADLKALKAEGEILYAPGNRYCMSPPTLLAPSQDNLVGLRFRGDRAFLPLAHEVLRTDQAPHSLQLRPKVQKFEWLRPRLYQVGICILTTDELVDNLPPIQKPQRFALQGCERMVSELDRQLWIEQGEVKQYIPNWQEQSQRWKRLSEVNFEAEALLRLSKDSYIWVENQTFYDIDANTAINAMFYLDQVYHQPLQIVWLGNNMNQLDLQGIQLPAAHAQLIWQLSRSNDDRPRIRYVLPANRPFVEAALRKLGCRIK